MAKLAHIDAKRANARRLNRSGSHLPLLPGEDPAEFEALLAALTAEHCPTTPTEAFLVRELVHAEWKLRRIARLEFEILTGDKSDVAVRVGADCGFENQLAHLTRYETAARNAWHRALSQLRSLRKERTIRSSPQNETKPNTRPYEAKPIAPFPQREPGTPQRQDPLSDRSAGGTLPDGA